MTSGSGEKRTLGPAATGLEGKESTDSQKDEFMTQSTASNPLLTLWAVAQFLGATVDEVMAAGHITYRHALNMASKAGLNGPDDFTRVPLIPDADVDLIGQNIERDRAEDADDEIEQIDSVVINSANGLTAIVETFRGVATVNFTNHPDRLDSPEMLVDDIPQLIGALGRFYAAHHTSARQLHRNEDTIRAAAEVREGL